MSCIVSFIACQNKSGNVMLGTSNSLLFVIVNYCAEFCFCKFAECQPCFVLPDVLVAYSVVGRAKMWSQHMLPQMFSLTYSSDAFFLNLGVLLLRLAAPVFLSGSRNVLQIQPTYCRATVGDRSQARRRKVHMIGKSSTVK